MAAEKWKKVVGYEGIYSVSDRGRVRRDLSKTCGKAGTILKRSLRNHYPMVSLSKDGKVRCENVHVIVATAFHGPRPEGMNVNHRDGCRDNPRSKNLEWGTQSHNVKEAYRLKLRDCRGEGNGKSILTGQQVKEIRSAYNGMRGQQAALAKKYSISPTTVRKIVSRQSWSHI